MFFSHVRDDQTAIFVHPHGDYRSVHVTGNFCGWQSPGLPLRRAENGWVGVVESLPRGDLEYKFITDGRWISDPYNLTRRPDGVGGYNSVIPRDGRRGSFHQLSFHSPALGENRPYVLYLPPGYSTSKARFPVLYLLHGALDWEKAWLEKGDFEAIVARLFGEGAVGDLIVVMPRDNGELFRGDHRYADYLARDLVGHIDVELRTLAEPRRRALDGLSTGGFTSVVLGAARRDVYGSIGSMSGSHDARTFETIRANAPAMRAAGQRYRISCGTEEPIRDLCRHVARELGRTDVESEYHEARGGHDWPTWREALPGHLRFHWNNVKG